MNQNWNLFTGRRQILEAGLSWCKRRLGESHLQSNLAQIVTLQKWETAQFRKLARAGERWEAEQRYLAGIHRLRGKAFDLIVSNRIVAAKLYEVRRKARTGEGLREVNEAGIRDEMALEFNNAMPESLWR